MSGTASVAVEILIGTVPALGCSYWAYRASRRASDATETAATSAVEAEAYMRAKGIYESALEQLETQLRGLQEQLDRVNAQLSQERDTSASLRAYIRELETQVQTLERTVSDLRHRIALAPVDAANLIHGTATEGAGETA